LRGGGIGAPKFFLCRDHAQLSPCGGSRFELDEFGGLTLCLTGSARYAWDHGVIAGKSDYHSSLACKAPDVVQERLSLTWRWFRKSALLWASTEVIAARRWVCHFIESALTSGFSHDEVNAFLGGEDESGGGEESLRRFLQSKDAVMVPWLRASVLEAALRIPVHRSGRSAGIGDTEDAILMVALALLRLWDQSADHVTKLPNPSSRDI